MKLTLALPVLNQLNDFKGILQLLKTNTSPDVEFMIIDNGSEPDVEKFVLHTVKPKRLNYIRNEQNVGVLKSYQQAYENCETDILAIMHNDVFIYEKEWDKRVIKQFEIIDKLGMVGFFGSSGCGPVGERIQDIRIPGQAAGWSNMLEAEIHGMRMDKEYQPVAIFDAFFMAYNMEMLRLENGFDMRYKFNHLHDRDMSLQSLSLGYKNIVLNVPCHHVCGITANRPEYQGWIDKKTGNTNNTGDKYTHDYNTQLFADKWAHALPIYVEDDFSFRSSKSGPWQFKGDAILKK